MKLVQDEVSSLDLCQQLPASGWGLLLLSTSLSRMRGCSCGISDADCSAGQCFAGLLSPLCRASCTEQAKAATVWQQLGSMLLSSLVWLQLSVFALQDELHKVPSREGHAWQQLGSLPLTWPICFTLLV